MTPVVWSYLIGGASHGKSIAVTPGLGKRPLYMPRPTPAHRLMVPEDYYPTHDLAHDIDRYDPVRTSSPVPHVVYVHTHHLNADGSPTFPADAWPSFVFGCECTLDDDSGRGGRLARH